MKGHKKRRRAALLLAIALLGCTALPTAAITPPHAVTGAYKTSTYHQNLLNIPRTGDKAFDTVAAAMTQVGYHEGNGTAELHGKNADGYKNYTEYNRVLGKIDGTYGYAWCAAFVSWCLSVANATDAASGQFASCSLWIEALRADGRYSTRASGYRPKEGDLIFFCSPSAGRASDHVGLVRYVSGSRVYTVEGNSSNKVSLNSYALSDTYIVGYGKPDYGQDLIPSEAFSYEDTANGWYVITNDFVNVRAGAGTSHAKLGRLYAGETVRIFEIKNGWGAFRAGDETRYVSLDYADFVSPLIYRVSYDADGGDNAPAALSYFSIERRTVSAQAPSRSAHRFLHWETADGRVLNAGDTLPLAALTLTAVWEPEPVVEVPPVTAPPADTPPSADLPSEAPPITDADAPPLAEGEADSDLLAPPAVQAPLPEERPQGEDLTAADVATTVTLLLAGGGALGYFYYKKRKNGHT